MGDHRIASSHQPTENTIASEPWSPRSPAYRNHQASDAAHPLPQHGPFAGGLFQELRYPVPQSLPGPTAATTSRYDLSFRDFSGHPEPTSHAYLNRLKPAPGTGVNGWKGLRLDHGPNIQAGNATNWHWNQKGAASTFGIANHAPASPAARTFGRILQAVKPLGRGAMLVGAGLDALSLGRNAAQSAHTGHWDNTAHDASRIAGGWGGAWAGAKLAGTAGAGIGTAICPGLGTAIGGAVGGFAGGVGGYFAGSKLGSWLGHAALSVYHGMYD